MGTEHFRRYFLIRLALIWNSCFVEDIPLAVSEGIETYILFNITVKLRCQIDPVKQRNININE